MNIIISDIYNVVKPLVSVNLAIQLSVGFFLFISSIEISKRIKMKITMHIVHILHIHNHNFVRHIKLYLDAILKNIITLIFLYTSQIIFWITSSPFNILNIFKYIIICDTIGKLTYKISEKKYYYYISIFITAPVILLYTDPKLFSAELDYSIDLILFKTSIREVLKLAFTLTVIFLFNKKLISIIRDKIYKAQITENLKIILSKISTFSVHFIFVVIILKVLGFNLSGLTVFTGAMGVGIGLGLQKIAINIISGFGIISNKSFTIGNYIEIDGIQGFVEKIGMRNVSLRLKDNKSLLIPNEKVITSNIISTEYVSDKKGKVFLEISISHESDAEMAIKIIYDIVNNNSFTIYKNESRVFVSGIVKFTSIVIVFWVDDIIMNKALASHEIMLSILKEFKKNNIHLYRDYIPV